MKKSVFLLLMLLTCIASARAQQYFYCGVNKADTLYRNEAIGMAFIGHNTVTDMYGGTAFSYRHHFTPRWTAGGSTEYAYGKEKFGIYAQGSYRLPWKYFNFYFSGKIMYNRYQRFRTNEYAYNLSATWEAPHFSLVLGGSMINFHLLQSSYWEPLTLTFGFCAHIRPRTSSWNVGLFLRNYDEFYYENWNINWGLDFLASINKQIKLYGEFVLRPAGSLSQLASNYETSFKAGVKYYWK